MFSSLLNPLIVLISLSTATSLLVHDMHVDTVASTALSMPVAAANYDASSKLASFGGDSHTHVERGAMAQAIINLQGQNPRIQPRIEDKKYLLQKRVVRGHYAFDNYSLPIV
jgi:hypothetical protein